MMHTINSNDDDDIPILVPLIRAPSQEEMHAVFTMCRQNRWNSVLDCIRSNHLIPITSMVMDNHISTTILHQAITSKGDTKARTRVILEILDIAPKAAAIKNGYGSLPLHVISQRNTKLDAPTKELLINELVNAYKGALVEQGGVGKRTPLHIIYTDYISPRVTEMMVQNGREACFMKDKKGYLPAHVACSRHCSPEKLDMLLKVNRGALTAKTNSGDTLLSLAVKTATRTHPNYALIDDLKRRVDDTTGTGQDEMEILKDEEARRVCKFQDSDGRRHGKTRGTRVVVDRDGPVLTSIKANSPRVSSDDESDKSYTPSLDEAFGSPVAASVFPRRTKMTTRKRKVTEDEGDMDSATLLLHFSRHMDKNIKLIASV